MTRPGAKELRDGLDAVRAAYEHWRHSAEALAAAAALWGGGCNDCGVFLGFEAEDVARLGRDCYARVRIAETPCGLYACGIDYRYGAGGGGYAPTVWCRPFETRQEAKQQGVRELVEELEGPHGRPAERGRALLLRRLKQQNCQPSLFDL